MIFNTVLAAVVVFVVINGHSGQAANNTAVVITNSSQNSKVANPLDKLSASDIAVSIANVTHLPEATAVRNQAETVQADLAVPPAEDVIAAKPQVVATALKDRQDIQLYTVKAGDTVSSLASKFDVTSDSITWSNNISGDALTPGKQLYIPPINGVVYRVKAGDTPQSLAQTYSSNAQQIISFNNAELSGLKTGEIILIPNGQVQPPVTYAYDGQFSSYGFTPAYGDNGYDFGFCTWYVATQIPVPSNWGNASSWAYYAQLSGWRVSSAPSVGAIAQNSYMAGGLGHVGIVIAVKGSQVEIRDMNDPYWDVVSTHWVSASQYPNYITK